MKIGHATLFMVRWGFAISSGGQLGLVIGPEEPEGPGSRGGRSQLDRADARDSF